MQLKFATGYQVRTKKCRIVVRLPYNYLFLKSSHIINMKL
nr:MAG TPA_asm: hypothetical protein [Bacteriophage sp.]